MLGEVNLAHSTGAEQPLNHVAGEDMTESLRVARAVVTGSATLPVNFSSPPHECSVASPFWGTIPELIDVIDLAQAGKITMLVEHFPLEEAAHAYHLLHDGKIPGRAVLTPND